MVFLFLFTFQCKTEAFNILETLSFIFILIIGLIGGFFDTFVGAGSLITIPTLIFLGLPPSIAIATNRLGVTGSDIAGWYKFHKKKFIDYKIAIVLAIPSLLGSIIGANLVLEFNESLLKKIVAIMTILIMILIILNPRIGIEKNKKKILKKEYYAAVFLSFIVGIYGGFYGAGAGIFIFYILILFFGQTFLESAATRKLANLSFSVMAAIVFAYKGIINYLWVIPLFVGTLTGAYFSAHYSEKIGNVWIKRLFIMIVSVMVLKLLI